MRLLVLGICLLVIPYMYAQDVHTIEKHFKGLKKENLSKSINTKHKEFSPAISPDGKTLFFSRMIDSDVYFYQSELQADGSWSKAKKVGYPFDKIPDAIGYNKSPDGNILLMRGVFSGLKQVARGYSFCKKTTNGWSNPIKLDIDNYEKYDRGKHFSAWLGADEQTLIMEMDPVKDSDNGNLYVSFLKPDGTWSEPKDLGPTINTSETLSGTPFLAADGKTLYYTTNKYDNYGISDIFVTKRLDDSWTNWSTPQNLGKVVNTSKFDAYFSIPASGEYAYLVSTENSIGQHDIFQLKLPEEAKPEPVTLVKGYILDENTQKPLATTIVAKDLDKGTELASAHSNPSTGFYELVLPRGKKYAFYAEHEGYYSVRENIDLEKLKSYKEIKKDLRLVPFDYGERMLLNNVFFVPTKAVLLPSALAELDNLYDILKRNPKMRIRLEGHTDNQGDASLNLKLSKERAEKVLSYLVDKGITRDRMEAEGYGGSKPLNDNSTESKRKDNRRVEFMIIK